jgi:DNA repair photolyase
MELKKIMKFEKSLFEEEGIRIDKDRVLTYSHLSCPLDCKYCFIDDLRFNQLKNVAYLTEKQWDLIKKLPDNIRLIMLGCDTEFFQNKEEALSILTKLAETNRDVSVITKLSLSEDFIKRLGDINKRMRSHNNVLSFSVSLPCFESSKLWEPKAPSPQKRIKTLQRAREAGLMTLVAIRPLLPNLNIQEIERIISSTKEYTDGYYSGPLYLKDFDDKIKSEYGLEGCRVEQVEPHWMPGKNSFYKISREGQEKMLAEIIKRNNKPFFEGAAEGIKLLKSNYEKY